MYIVFTHTLGEHLMIIVQFHNQGFTINVNPL